MPNTEDIEARLCAYVDGELDAAGRAEIQRHLSTNPHHRKLIEELTVQRDMLRALPRARAPIDVAESLNAQLERSALLSDDDWHEPIRISRWPQIRAAAAVLLLVFGLAAVVYYVVPSPNQPHGGIVLNVPPAGERSADPSDDADAGPGEPSTAPAGTSGTVLTATGRPDGDFIARSAQEQRALVALAIPEMYGDGVVSNAIAPHLQVLTDAFGGGAKNKPLANATPVTILVAAADPVAAQRRVESYLQNRGIAFEPSAPQTAMQQGLVLDPRQQLPQARRPSHVMSMDREGNPEVAVIPDFPGAARRRDGAVQPVDAGAPAPGAPVDEPDAIDRREHDALVEDRTGDPVDTRVEGVSSDTATVLAEVPAAQQQAYLARRLTRREVERLYADMNDPRAHQVAQIVEDTALDATPTPEQSMQMVVGDWSGVFPWLAQSHAGAGTTSQGEPQAQRSFTLLAPGTRPPGSADENLDVLIVVRHDPEQRHDATDAAPPADEDADPATEPSSP